MPRRAQLSVPANGALPHSHRLPSTNPDVSRTISRLSRHSLISLALQWLHKNHRAFCEPYLAADHDDEDADNGDAPYEPAQSHEELQEIYEELQNRKGGRKEVAERILEGDWRHGISLYQLATAETQYLLDHPTSLRWSAQRLAKIENPKRKSKELSHPDSTTHLPRFHAHAFLLNLVREVSPLVKAHYYLTRLTALPLTLLRISIHDSPYAALTLPTTTTTTTTSPPTDASKALYLLFPDASPFIYISLATPQGQSTGQDGRSLRKVVLDAVPKAFSRPGARYALHPTSLSARALSALLALRGPGRSNNAQGGWSVFAAGEGEAGGGNALDFA
ncbi:CHL4-domain-containing protein, partial [Glonium stellatum]